MTVLVNVKTFRDSGLEAKWGRSHGRPALFVRDPMAKLDHQRTKWWMVTRQMHTAMESDGIKEAFASCTLLGDVFSVPV